MGYGWEFWWLATENVTFRWQATEILSHIPLRLTARAFACSLRSTRKSSTTKSRCDFFAQNDIQWFYLVMFVSLATKSPRIKSSGKINSDFRFL